MRHITNDLNSYGRISLAADGKVAPSVLSTYQAEALIFPADKVPTLDGAAKIDDARWLDWIGNDKLLIGDNADHTLQVSTLKGAKSVLFSSGDLRAYDASVCAGKSILFAGEKPDKKAETRLWSIDLEGNGLQPITPGPADQYSACSADGQWIAFFDFSSASVKRLHRTDGKVDTVVGKEEHPTAGFGISDDGREMVVITRSFGEGNSASTIRLISFDTGQTTKKIPISGAPFLATGKPGGKFLAVVVLNGGADNIWLQPLDGGTPKQWTQFGRDRATSISIRNLAWSPDKKWLAISYATIRGNVVLFRDRTK